MWLYLWFFGVVLRAWGFSLSKFGGYNLVDVEMGMEMGMGIGIGIGTLGGSTSTVPTKMR